MLKTVASAASNNEASFKKAVTNSSSKELNIEIVNAFIEKIFVHEKVRSEGKTYQAVEFVFKVIGKIDLEALEL